MHASAVASALQRVPEKRGAPSVPTSELQSFANVLYHPLERISTPTEFLTKIGRSMAEHDGKLGSTWEELWSRYATSEDLEKAGVSAPKERKYILRQMNNYKNGQEIKAIRAKPKKKFRG